MTDTRLCENIFNLYDTWGKKEIRKENHMGNVEGVVTEVFIGNFKLQIVFRTVEVALNNKRLN